MRFGRRNRGSFLFGRRGNRQESQSGEAHPPPFPEEGLEENGDSGAAESSSGTPTFDPVRQDERSALMGGEDASAWDAADAAPVFSGSDDAGDAEHNPVQRLLTALGRFQREVAKAHEGVPADRWAEECMNQLINAVDIGLEQGWHTVVEALGQIGRILQTYYLNGRADECIGFLDDSYEILCLMVSDLFVGSVRESVREKWQERYAQAVEDVAAAGLTLIEDGADDSAGTASAPVAPGSQPAGTASDFEALEELSPGLAGEAPLPVAKAGPGEDEAALQADTIAAMLDQFSGALEDIAQLGPDAGGEAYDNVMEALATLNTQNRAAGHLGAVTACEMMARVTEKARVLPVMPDDKFIELAYGFPGICVEAADDTQSDMLQNWLAECETLIVSWTAFDADTSEALAEAEASIAEDIVQPASSPDSDEAPHQVEELAEVETPGEAGPEPAEAATPLEEPEPDAPEDIDLDAAVAALVEGVDDDPAASADAGSETSASSGETSAEEMLEATPASDAEVHEAAAAEIAAEQALEEESLASEGAGFAAAPAGQFSADTPESMMLIAKRAVAEGNPAKAKLLLLKAAACIAQSEAEEAQAQLKSLEEEVQAEIVAIDEAMHAVHEAETHLKESEQAVEEGSTTVSERIENIGAAEGVVQQDETALDELEEELKALIERRDNQAAKLEEARAELARAQEARAAAEEEL